MSAAPWVPAGAGVEGLRVAATGCEGCELHRPATQTVFSAGSALARVVLVGEQPGDVEDREGEPFVGPAGQLLDRALAEAGIDRSQAYVTNVVKHFRFRETGRRRLHQTPDLVHMTACRPWLDAELAVVDPDVLVCLGATAAKALFGSAFRVTRQRGRLFARGAGTGWMMATNHPSAVLRADDRDAAYAALVADLRVAAAAVVPV
jgi:DNA polymerase